MQTFAIIPAAGRSERMGKPKLLLPWGTISVIEHVLSTWRASLVNHIVLVVHPQDHEIADVGRRMRAVVVQPEIAPKEMKVSVRLGLELVQEQFRPVAGDAWMLAPADMPTMETRTIDRLIDAYCASQHRGAPRCIWEASAGGRRGHPVLFPWSLAPAAARLGTDEGIDALLRRNVVETIDAGPAATFDDLDTPEDYDRLRARHGV